MPDATRTSLRLVATLATCLALGGCATAPGELAPDPLEPINRVTATMNKVMDDVVVQPAARAYVTVAPEPVQETIHNFFLNLQEPIVIVNDLLQGKFRQSGADTGRFLANSTFGVLGLFDVASAMGLERHNEDLGQTLAVWGVPSGPYLVLPLLGPSNLRAGIGGYVDGVLNPIGPYDVDNVAVRNPAVLLKAVDMRSQLLDLQKQLNDAFDPYTFIRDAWSQHRRFLIYDGNPPAPAYPELPAPND